MVIPHYFMVKRSNSPAWEEYIEWLNKFYNENWEGHSFEYYGYSADYSNNGTSSHDYISDFRKSTVLFNSPEEFMNLINNKTTVRVMVNQFNKGDYIVILPNKHGSQYQFTENYCFRQRSESSCLAAELDRVGSVTNAWGFIHYKNTENNWRYATQEEINHYNTLGKPFDVTTLNIKHELWI